MSLRLMPLAACIDPTILPRVYEFEMGRPFESVTEEDWKDYFMRGTEHVHFNFEAIDRAMSYLSMKTQIPDGESRVMQLVADFYVKLEEANLPTLYESEPRKYVRYLVNAIRPPALKASVERELEYESNRYRKKQWREFVHWMTKQARDFSRYEQVQPRSGAKTQPTNARRTDELARRQSSEAGSKVVAWARSDSAPKKMAQSVAPVRACLKCKSVDHLVWKCPEAARLYEEMKAARKGEATKKKTAPVNGWVSGSGEELRSVPCKIGGVHVEAVLESGADQSVMCPRLVEKLEAAGIWMTSRALDKEVELAGIQEGL